MFIFQSKFNNPPHSDGITEKKWDFQKSSMGLPNFKGRKSGLPGFESYWKHCLQNEESNSTYKIGLKIFSVKLQLFPDSST